MNSLAASYADLPLAFSIALTLALLVLIAIVQNVIRQLFFANPHCPPVVFHVFPLIGSTIQYGIDPYKFFFDCRARYGDCFTFILLGKPTTVFLGKEGNNFILNGKHADLNAEEVYGKLTTPVFGKGVVYDCPNEKLMDQKRVSFWRRPFERFSRIISFVRADSPLNLYVPTSQSSSKKWKTISAHHPGSAASPARATSPR